MPITFGPDNDTLRTEYLERIANSLEELVECLKNNNPSSH